jgi:hypothetical protein
VNFKGYEKTLLHKTQVLPTLELDQILNYYSFMSFNIFIPIR